VQIIEGRDETASTVRDPRVERVGEKEEPEGPQEPRVEVGERIRHRDDPGPCVGRNGAKGLASRRREGKENRTFEDSGCTELGRETPTDVGLEKPVALQLECEAAVPWENPGQLCERRNQLAGERRHPASHGMAPQLLDGHVGDGQGDAAGPLERGVVDADEDAVARDAEVGLDQVGAFLDREPEGGEVFPAPRAPGRWP
jgi:hypothetical protein